MEFGESWSFLSAGESCGWGPNDERAQTVPTRGPGDVRIGGPSWATSLDVLSPVKTIRKGGTWSR